MHLELVGRLTAIWLLIATIPGCLLFEIPLDREKWGPLPQGPPGECPDLTGTYRVDGEATDARVLFWFLPVRWRREAEQDVRLDRDLRLLLDEPRKRALAIDHLREISFSHLDASHLQIVLHYNTASVDSREPDTLTLIEANFIRYGPENGTIEDRAYSFGCYDGMLHIRVRGSERPSRDPSFTNLTRRLGRLDDGALVVRAGQTDPLKLFSYSINGSSWHRYQKIPANPNR